MARGAIYSELNRQASAMGYVDVYRLLGWMSLGMMFCAFLLSNKKPGEGSPRCRMSGWTRIRKGDQVLKFDINEYARSGGCLSGDRIPQEPTSAPRSTGMNPQRFTIHLIRFGILAISVAALSVASFAQQGSQGSTSDASSLPKAQQVPPSGRATSGGGVQAQQSANGNGGTSSVNTVNSTIQVSGPYQGSIPDPNAPHGPLTLNIADAIGRGLRFNLGAISANSSVRQLRGQRLAALSLMLPNIYATLSETGAKIDLQSQGLTVIGTTTLPTTVGPFHYYSAFANVAENFSITSLHNLRQAQASADAAQMSAQDARELITLAVSGTYLQILASKANVASQEAQVKQAEATFKQSEDRYAAGTKPVIDRNRSFVEFHTEQQRLTLLARGLGETDHATGQAHRSACGAITYAERRPALSRSGGYLSR
jgi:hypothetical protein